MPFAYAMSGLLVGILVGLTGVGSGSLMTPILTLGFGFHPTIAVGTDLAFAAITKSVGTALHHNYSHVKWHIVKLLCLGSLPSALVTIYLLKQVGHFHTEWLPTMRTIIGIGILLTALSLFFRQRLQIWLRARPQYQLQGHCLTATTIIVGTIIGVLVTLTSMGAGAIGASLIIFLYPTLKPAEIIGTDIAYVVPLTLVASMGHAWLGTVNFDLLPWLLLGSVPGIWLGTHLSKKLSEPIVRNTLATVLTLTSLKMIAL
ncbi:MAG: sulfite exporter TauE/SafE family protein [Ottowia sp.]|nr:sulfite exporter TauE/SafE family protein [Ottowia sp.]